MDTFGPKTSAPTVCLYRGSKDKHLGSLCAWYGTCVEYFKYENVGYLHIFLAIVLTVADSPLTVLSICLELVF